jgi:hypothetical protein
MEVNTDSFRALTARADAVDAIAADVAQIRRHLASQQLAVSLLHHEGHADGFAEGRLAGLVEAQERDGVGDRDAETQALRELARAQLADQLERAALVELGEQRAMDRMGGRRPEGRRAAPRRDRRGLRLVGGTGGSQAAGGAR